MLDFNLLRTPPRSPMPDGEITLSDGRTLSCFPSPFGPSMKSWKTPDGDLRILASHDDDGRWGPMLHISLSHPDRNPSWETIKAVRDAFFPDSIDVMMILPRAEDYVNVHEFTFHLQETPQQWGRQ